MVDTTALATQFAGELRTHQRKLQGDAAQAQAAQDALSKAATDVGTERDSQAKAATSLLEHWQGQAATDFQGKSTTFDGNCTTTATDSSQAAAIVGQVTDALAAKHSAVGNLVDDFIAKAARLFDTALAAFGAPSALIQAVGHVADLAGGYLKDSAGHLNDARTEMAQAAQQLRALEAQLNRDGIGDPKSGGHQPTPPSHKPSQPTHKPTPPKPPASHKGSTQTANSATVTKILHDAEQNVGYHEGPNNQNKWGPTGQPWCAYFATSMWREAGVNIPKYGFTGDIYTWGERHHTSYPQSQIASHVRPGDAIMFGTGPSWQGSEHVGIVEKVHGNEITTIEGNSDNQVMRHTYTLPRDAHLFYGGVHPT